MDRPFELCRRLDRRRLDRRPRVVSDSNTPVSSGHADRQHCTQDRSRSKLMSLVGNVENIDDFAACKITRKEDWVDLYAKPYYFGCEADDRMNAAAFGKNNPFGSGLKAIFSSDIGRFDVIDMRHPLPEAYELVEDEHITPNDFRAFTFSNSVKLWGTQNRHFFEGTRVAKQAAAVLAIAQTRPSSPPNDPLHSSAVLGRRREAHIQTWRPIRRHARCANR